MGTLEPAAAPMVQLAITLGRTVDLIDRQYYNQSMGNLALQIHRHIESLQILHVEIEQLYEAVGIKTSEAREKLMAYRVFKQQAENTLDTVSENYEQALNLFQQSDALFEKLKEIKAEHIVLSEAAVKRAEPESIVKLQQVRKQLRVLYKKIKKLRGEGLPSDCGHTFKSIESTSK